MQIVFQDPFASLNPRMTVGAILEEPLRAHQHCLHRVRFAPRSPACSHRSACPPSALARYPHEFSGGQRQRVGIARALSLRPKLIVADEPVSALDVSIRAQILNLFRRVQDETGVALLFIAHDLGAVRQISRRVAVMYLGKIVEVADADELYQNPRHPYTRTLLAAVPSIEGRKPATEKVTGDVPSPINIPARLPLPPPLPLCPGHLRRTRAPPRPLLRRRSRHPTTQCLPLRRHPARLPDKLKGQRRLSSSEGRSRAGAFHCPGSCPSCP